MKTSTIGIVSAAVLMVVAGVGFGIAQAAGIHSEQPVLSFEDQEAAQAATSAADDIQLASTGQEFVPEDNYSGTDWQMREPVETGAIPGAAVEESWMKDYGND
jgi:hypothetical protein